MAAEDGLDVEGCVDSEHADNTQSRAAAKMSGERRERCEQSGGERGEVGELDEDVVGRFMSLLQGCEAREGGGANR